MRTRQTFIPRGRGSRGTVRAIVIAAAVAIVATAGAVTSSGGSYASWNGAARTPASTVTAGTIAAGETFGVSPATTFDGSTSTKTVGLTIANSGNVTAAYSTATSLAAGSSAPLASTIAVAFWKVAALTACTPSASPVSPATGTWAAPPVLTGSLAGGASDLYCLRTTIGSVTGIPSTSQVTPTMTANLNVANTWTSAAASSFTQTFIDNVAPSTPGTFTGASTTGTSVALAWQASADNVGVTGYVVKRNGTTVSTGTGTTFTDTGLKPFTTYTYTVTATDAAGNPSTPATVSVWSGPDTTATYTITNSSSGRCIDANGAVYNSSGFKLVTKTCSMTASQKWSFQWVGSYLTVTSNANLVWDVANNSTTAGDGIITWPTNGGNNQHWQVNQLGGGLYQFQSQGSGMCMQVPSNGNNVQLVQQTCDASSTAQAFTIQ